MVRETESQNVSPRSFLRASAKAASAIALAAGTGAKLYAAGSDRIRTSDRLRRKGLRNRSECVERESRRQTDRDGRRIRRLSPDFSKIPCGRSERSDRRRRRSMGFDGYTKPIESAVDVAILAGPTGNYPHPMPGQIGVL